MIRWRRVHGLVGALVCAILGVGAAGAQEIAGKLPLATLKRVPEFGTQDYTVTTISALSFVPRHWSGPGFAVSPGLGRYCGCISEGMDYYAGLSVPAGAVIDYIGLNSTTDTEGVLGFGLLRRDAGGNSTLLTGFSAPAHGWATDYSGLLGIQVPSNLGSELVLWVEQGANPNYQFFGWVEVWWRRTVSPAPGSPTFNDVPTNHPFFQYVEALADAGITGGCGFGSFCPNDNVTRGQMAVFLAKALGLHWPG